MLIQLLSTPASAGNCAGTCAPAVAQWEKMENQLDKIRDILAKNEEYLKRNPSVSPSIAVKIRSNIMISRLQIETAQNEKALLEASLERQGCRECRKNTNASSKT